MTAPADTRISDDEMRLWHERLTEQIRLLRIRLDKTAITEDAMQYSELLSEAEFKLALITELRERRAQAVTVKHLARAMAVEFYDGIHGYTYEFAPSPTAHAQQYDYWEERFAEKLSTLSAPPPAQSADAAKEEQAVAVAEAQITFRTAWEIEQERLATKTKPPAPASGGVSEEIIDDMVERAARELSPYAFRELSADDRRSDDYAWTNQREAQERARRQARRAIEAALTTGKE